MFTKSTPIFILSVLLFINACHAEENESIIATSELISDSSIKNSTHSPPDTNFTEADIEIVIPPNSIKIGSQVWQVYNLNTTEFRNGRLIKEAKSEEEWEDAENNKTPAWCYYNFNPANGEKYGKLYNWFAINDSQGLAPVGWHIPNQKEWENLIIFLGGSDKAGKKIMVSEDTTKNLDDSNTKKFSALPGGYRGLFLGFQNLEQSAHWWSSTLEHESPIHYILDFKTGYLKPDNSMNKEDGRSVRCVMDQIPSR